MHKLPKEIEFVTDKILADHDLYDELLKLLTAVVTKLNNDSLSHSSFCDILKTPSDAFTKKLLTIYGLNDRQMLTAFAEIGFHPDSRMYSNLYYQTLSLSYYIGARANDDLMRQLSIVLIYVKLFNGRKYKWFPNGCQEEIGHYLLNNIFRESHTFKKYPNPFLAITNYFAPTLDNKYKEYVLRDPGHPTEGIISILKNGWVRMDQVFTGVKDHYYEAVKAGVKSSLAADTGIGGKEVDQLEFSKIEQLVDKISKVLIRSENILNAKDIEYLKEHYMISNVFIEKVNEFLNDSANDSDITNIYEVLFSVSKIQDETALCNMPVVSTVNQISNAKGNVNEITKLKTYVDNLLSLIFTGIMKSASQSQVLKLRKVLLLIITLRGKRSLCPKAQFEAAAF